jgi:hypothetical protein
MSARIWAISSSTPAKTAWPRRRWVKSTATRWPYRSPSKSSTWASTRRSVPNWGLVPTLTAAGRARPRSTGAAPWESSPTDRGTPSGFPGPLPTDRGTPLGFPGPLRRLDLGHGGRAPGRLVDLVEAGAGAGLDGGDHGALDDRGLGDADPAAGVGVDQLVDGHLGREHGRPEVDQDQHPVAFVGGRDGLGDQGGVGADAAVVGAARGLDAHRFGHLPGQLDHALGDLGRVGHHHQAHAHGPSTS